MNRGDKRRRRGGPGFEQLESRLAMAGVVINEFLALNTNGISDQDGDRTDWIELHNTGAEPVNLAGWRLTDDAADLDKWTLPSVNLPAGGYLLVFASGKNRATAGQELHTNFALAEGGEYLALVMPDGATVVDAYDPYPAQLANVSYGRGASALIQETLLGELAPVKALVPNQNTSAAWYAQDFDDSSWLVGAGGVGFDNVPMYLPYFNLDLGPHMLNVRASVYLRYGFTVADPAEVSGLTFRIRYDDGFAIYLNGTAIPAPTGRRNAPASLTYQSAATASHPDAQAIVYEDISLSAYRHLLVAGNNVLAIHGMNNMASNGDFLIAPLLVAERPSEAVTGYMVSPSPNAGNQQGSLGVVADTNFSVDRGFYTAPCTVQITTATADATIRYTLDGSAPTATAGLVYNPASPPLISTTTTLRAAAFRTGWTPTNIDTQTYIFLDDVIQQNGVGLPPSNWGWAGPDYAMDPAVVNNPLYGATIKDDLKAIPTVSLVLPWNDFFGGNGQGIYPTQSEIERGVSMEYFTPDGSKEYQIDGGIEVQGGTSDDRWKMDKLSLRVKFKAPYGPEKFDADIFNSGLKDANAAVSFNTLILDAHMGYTWAYGGTTNSVDQRSRAMYIQDIYVSDLQNLAGGQAPHGQFVHVYVNGLYWGMYDMHERADEHFAQSYLGGNDEDYDVIKHNATTTVSADVNNPGSAISNYATMLALVRQDLTVPANYAAAAAKIDVDDLITYMIVNYYVGNDDWAHQNWYATYNRVDPAGKWRYHSWDAENVLKAVNRDSTTLNNLGGPTEVFTRLMTNPEFRLSFNDHVQRLFYNGGLLTPASAAAVYQARMQEIDRAIIGESARWGDNHTTFSDPPGPGNPYVREHWVARQNDLLNNYFPIRTSIVTGQFQARGWLATIAAPLLSQYGGAIDPGFQLTLSRPASVPSRAGIYYTLDGSDPRLPGGGLNPAAVLYAGPITLNAATQVRARINDASNWSPEIDATFLTGDTFPVRITELHYNPREHEGIADAQDLEFIELMNTGAAAVSLNGVMITQFAGDPYAFPNGLTLSPGARIVVARDPVAFQQVYGLSVPLAPTGYADANLSNGGERIALVGPLGEVLQDFVFDDEGEWPASADGNGRSLEIIDPLGDAQDPANWRASASLGGSPGTSGLPDAGRPGDFDGDEDADGADFLAWQRGVGVPGAALSQGDADGDGDVDGTDLDAWRAGFGAPPAAAAVIAQDVLRDAGARLEPPLRPATRDMRPAQRKPWIEADRVHRAADGSEDLRPHAGVQARAGAPRRGVFAAAEERDFAFEAAIDEAILPPTGYDASTWSGLWRRV